MCVSKVHLNFTQTDDCKLSAQLLDMKKYSKVFFFTQELQRQAYNPVIKTFSLLAQHTIIFISEKHNCYKRLLYFLCNNSFHEH